MRKTIILIIVCVSVVLSIYPILYTNSSETIEITIKDKEQINTGFGENLSSKFLIFTETEVFQNTDSWLYFKFSSADYQNKLDPSKTYKVKVAGWRIPFFSSYRNIVEIY